MNAPAPIAGPAHAVYAPSSAHRWMICTASASAIAAFIAAHGEIEEGEEAADGTAAHDEIERCLSRLNDLPSIGGGDYLALREDVNPAHPAAYGVALVIDYVRQLVEGAQNGSRLWIEQRVRLTDQIWGRCDVAHFDMATGILTIVDYKNGYVNVEAEANEQLLIYAAATAYTRDLPVRWIRLVVVQPNSFLPVPRVKQWGCTPEYLYEFAKRAAAVPTSALQFVPGESCTYCPIFGVCEASRDVLTRLGAAMASRPRDVPLHQRALFDAMAKPIADWFKEADKDWTKDAVTEGKVPPDMKVVTSQKHRVWNNPKQARDYAYEAKGIELFDAPTPAQAEKAGLDLEKMGGAVAPPGAPTLAPMSDKRAAWVPKSAKEMFQAAVAQERST